MKTKVKVIVELEVQHEEKMPMGKIEELARNSIRHSQTFGAFADYGHYEVIEIGRITEV